MRTEKLPIHVSDSIGSVSAEITTGAEISFLYVFAHGAGAGMNHPFMVKLSDALADLGVATMRYNFPYMEKGKKRPDPPAISEKTVRRAIETADAKLPGVRILAGGKSFGGRMTSQALATSPDQPVQGIVFVGFPLHAAGSPGIERAAHLKRIVQPMLFLQGTRDALADLTLMESVCSELRLATLHKFEGADHSFKTGKQDLIPALANAVKAWTEDKFQ